MPTCHCQVLSSSGAKAPVLSQPPVRPVAALGVSFLVAFFPKCPVCWAAYMSALGIGGMAQVPYMGFLFPVLVAMLGVHLRLLFRQGASVGWGPFILSIAGAVTILIVREYAPLATWALNSGVVLMLGGSVWNSFSMKRWKTPTPTSTASPSPSPSPSH